MANWTLFLLSEKANAHNGQRRLHVHKMLLDAPFAFVDNGTFHTLRQIKKSTELCTILVNMKGDEGLSEMKDTFCLPGLAI